MMEDKLPGEKKLSWWERRTRIEKCLLVATGFFVATIIYLASNLLMRFPTASKQNLKRDVCFSENCIRSAASLLEKMDKTVDPCEDFYKFACGKFIKEAIIPDDKVLITSFAGTSDKILLKLLDLLEQKVNENDPHSLKLLKNNYKSCMNTTIIEKEGVNYVKEQFKKLGGWPVIDPYWNEKNFDWKLLLFRLQKIGWRWNLFFTTFVNIDKKNSSKRILTINQPCFPSELLIKGFNDTGVKATYEFLVEMSVLFGADRAIALVDMKDVMNFEIEFSKIIVPYAEQKNQTEKYNHMTIKELQKKYPSLPWLKLINGFLAPIDVFTSDDIVDVSIPKFLERLETFIPKIKKRALANYMFSRIVRDSIFSLPDVFRRKLNNLYQILYDKKEVTPRWMECVWQTTEMNIAVSSAYIKKYFDNDIKRKATELVIDIKSAFIETLKKIGWMDRKTKRHALLKAEKIGSVIAYPNEILDNNKVEEFYQDLEIDPNAYYLEVLFNRSKISHKKMVEELKQPVEKPDWRTRARVTYVNAFYGNSDNTIEIPAAILQDSFYNPDRPQYLNYGSLGEVAGHEITHGFDDHGRQYDKDSNLVDWWDPETNRTFTRKSQCLIDQYGNYTVPEIEMSLNGQNTLSENIADNGGIKIAYRGYLKWLERNKEEPSLPGLPYTPKQLFWISAAGNSCTKYKKGFLKQMVTSGMYSPAYFRVILPFMNSDHFGKDFNCPLGSPMNPKYKCRVW